MTTWQSERGAMISTLQHRLQFSAQSIYRPYATIPWITRLLPSHSSSQGTALGPRDPAAQQMDQIMLLYRRTSRRFKTHVCGIDASPIISATRITATVSPRNGGFRVQTLSARCAKIIGSHTDCDHHRINQASDAPAQALKLSG